MTHQRLIRISTRRPRRGFAFTEILFAVMVLGIGFIMIAAMFPVTIRQTQNTLGDTQGANEALAAMAYLQSIGTNANFPSTVPGNDASKPAQVLGLRDVLFPTSAAGLTLPGYVAARGNMIDPNNPRLAWIPLYRRGVHTVAGVTVPDSFAQVFVIAVQSRNRPEYVARTDGTHLYTDFDVPGNPGTGDVATLDPKPVKVTVRYDTSAQHGVLTFVDAVARPWAAPGAYVIVSDDKSTTAPLNRAGQSNGRIYQLGEAIDEANGVWGLMPGSDMIRKGGATAGDGDDNDIDQPSPAYMVGRGYTNAESAADGYSGPAQELGVYTGYIQVSPDNLP
jgi:hypothetical protein